MGENVDDCPYPAGTSCPACNTSLFDGRTPQYVLATFQGIIACPGLGASPWNAAFLLTQDIILPCTWRLDTGTALIVWTTGGTSGLSIIEHFGLPRNIFVSGNPGVCLDEFANGFVVCGPINGGKFGTGIVTWGCSIHA